MQLLKLLVFGFSKLKAASSISTILGTPHLQFRAFMLLLFLSATGSVVGQATVTTDKSDYVPGEYVIISGTGWSPGETVSLHFDETPKPATCVLAHDITVIADANGNIYSNSFLIKENHIGVSFVLTATGLSSGLKAVAYFTDATWNLEVSTNGGISYLSNNNSGTVSTLVFSACESKTITFKITQTNASRPNLSYSIALPIGFTISVPSSVTASSSKNWSASQSYGSNSLCIKASTTNDALSNQQSIVFTATVTSSAGIATTQLIGRAQEGPQGQNPPNFTCVNPTATGVGQLVDLEPSFSSTSDNVNPTITAPLAVSVNADNGSCAATNVVLGSATTADNCGVASVTNNAPASFPVGPTTVTWTVTDVNGRTATATQVVTVTDNQDPTITAPPAVNVNADNGSCAATNVVLGSATTADNCGVASVTNNAPSSFPVGSTTVTWTVTDVNGRTATATQIVTVTDNQDPTITAPPAVNVNADNGSCAATNVALGSATTADNCGVASVTNNAPASFPVGSTTVTWTVTDVNGRTATATQIVTVTDNQDPTINAPSAVNVNADNGSCAATNVVLGSATTADNCGVASVTNNAPASFPVGSTTVTWTVTDVNGRTATATQIVTVTDNQDPTITAPPAVNVNADNGSCAATNVALGSATTADNCGVASVTNNAPASFPVGPTTVTWTVIDVNGRTATATQVVTVTDNQDPIITAPPAVNMNADNGSCAATNVALGSATTADNCGVASVTNNAPASFSVGSTTVTWTVTDVNGRTATATQIVTVTDNQDPTITAPSVVSVNADNGSCAATNVALGSATTADNCGVASVTNNAPSSFPVGPTTVTWTVTDVNGRTATATQIVTVTDNQDPTITAPSVVSVNADNGSCAATNVALGSATTADNCGVASVTNNAPASFPVGSTTVTWTVTDVNGRTATATQVVTVTDNQNPVISNTPADITVYTGVGSTTCNKVVTWTAPTASDNCTISTFTSTHTSGTAFAVGTTTVTYTATDVNGNSVTSSFTVTVIDNTAPVVNVQNFTLNLTAAGTGTVTAAQINNGSTDNCGIASVVLSKTNFTCADLGSQTVTLTVTDIHGNSASANATVLVKDVTPPTVLTKNITVNLDASGNASITAAQVDNGSSDVCGPVTLSVTPSVFNCSNTSALSNDLIISEYVEGSGNEKYIEIYNGTGVSINLSDYRLRLYANGATTPTNDVLLSGTLNSGSTITYKNNLATLYSSAITNAAVNFNGDDAIVLWKISTGSPVDIFGVIGNDPGTTWTSGGNSTLDRTLRRKSNVKNGVTVNPTGTGAGAFATLLTEWDQFNIDDVTGLGSHTMNTGGNTVTLTVTDGSGNQASGTATVTLVDNIAPTLTPAANQNVNLGANCSIVVPDVRGTATDNCAGVTITQSPVAGSSISLTHNQTTNITVTATDASGNATVKTVVLTAKDVTPPVLTPAANQNVNLNSNCSIVVPNVLGTATDNCASVTITQIPTAGTVIPLSHDQTISVTVTATDVAGLTDIETVVLTAKDVTAPTVITKNITVQLDANGTASITAADVNNGSTDNCGTVNLVSVTPSIFNCTNTNQPSATELIISEYVEGNSNIKYLEIYNGTSAAVNLGNYSLRVYSNGSSTVTASNVLSGTLASGAAIVYKNSAATGYDGASTPLTMMTFNGDDAVALFNNSTNQFVDIIGKIGNDPGTSWTGSNGYTTLDATLRRKATIRNGVTVNPTGTGASAFATLTTEWELYSTDDVSGLGAHFMNTGNKTAVTLLVNDGNGNTASGYAYVTVQDNIKPVITTNGDKTVNTDPGVCGATVTVSAGATDNCSVGTPTGVRSDGLALTALYPVGTTTIKWNVTDINGNAAIEVTQTVVVTDNEKPVITANGDKTVNTDPGVCGATVTVSANATDNCSVGTPAGVRSDGLALTALYPVGTTTIKWNVTDVNGNAAIEVTQTVVVTDNEKPVITANGDKTVNTDPGVCGATVTVSASATDNCSVGTPTGVRSDGLALTALYPVGTTTIKWNVTDVNGNAAIQVTQTVVVTDNEKPVITSNLDKTVNTDPGVCGATVTVSASATDNCSVGTPTGVRSDGLALTALYPVGTTTIKWNVTDVNGNTAIEVTQTVVVTDNEKPNAVAQNVTIYLNASGAATTTAAAVNNGSSDNCGVATLALSKTDFNCSNVGNNTVTLTVTDVNGNSSTTTAVVIVKDEIAPTAVAQNVIIYLNVAGTASTTAEAVNNGSSDNCGVADLLLSKTDFDCSNVGNNTVTLTVTDVNGNSSTATATITVIDNIAPNVITQNITVQLDASGNVSITTAQIDNGSTDACGIQSYSLDNTTFTCANVGANTVTLTVTDVNGNVATKTAVVTVKDEVTPNVITQNITVQLDASGNVSITAAQIDNGSTDACGIQSYSLDNTTFTCANVGANTVTLTVTDVNGNVATKTAVVTVKDEVTPNVITQNITVQLDASGNASITAAQIDNGSSDACGIQSYSLDKTTFNCSNVGANTVTLTVTDVNGNVATKTAVVTVKDEVAPNVITQNITVQLDASGNASITAAQIDNGSSDACGIQSYSLDKTTFNCSNVGANTVTLTVTDVNGNVATKTAVVTVKDEVAPNVITQNITVQLDANGNASITPAQIDNGSTDACGIQSYSLDKTTFTCANVGANTVTLTVTDINGNVATKTAVVTVKDEIAPTAVAQNVTIYLNAAGAASTTAAAVNNGSSDNCSIAELILSKTAFSCGDVGDNNVVLTVKDASGNTSTANAVVKVLDKIAPVAVCQNVTVNLGQDGTVTVTAAQVNNGSSDACGIKTLALSQTVFTAVGTYPVVLTVTDVNDNISTCTATVSVNKRPAVLTYTGDNNEQYSDNQTLTATLTDEATGNPLSGKTINFTIGTQAVSAVTNASGVATATLILTQNPDVVGYTVKTVFAGDAIYLAANDTDAFDILDEDARIYYTGSQFVSTASATSSSATVTLSATVRDITAETGDAAYDLFAGDIRNARVFFKINETGQQYGPFTPGLVNAADLKTGTVTTNITLDIGASDSKQFTLSMWVDGYYARNASTDNEVITISKPIGDFITGGGYIITSNATGLIAPKQGVKSNFGFNVKYNKSGTNLQGNINTIIRGEDGKVYQIKGNSMTSLSVTPATTSSPAKAVFNGKASIQDITDPLNVIAVDGGASLQVTMTDKGEPGKDDRIAITVWNKNGGLWFASNWDGVRTQEQQIAGGNLKVQSGTSATGSIVTSTTVTSSANPSFVGNIVTFKAVVNETNTAVPTGKIMFYDGNILLATVNVTTVSGVTSASFVTSVLSAGDHDISAYFAGDSKFAPSSGSVLQKVNVTTVTIRTTTITAPKLNTSLNDDFNVKVLGNPSLSTFRLQLQSSDKQQKITVKIVDVSGRIVEVKENLYAGQVIEVGSKYTQGTYFAEAMQGSNRKVVKLIKVAKD